MPVSHPPPDRFAVEPRKVALYLLNVAHPDGRSKANFFIGRPQELAAALLDHSRAAALAETSSRAWAPRFVYEGPLVAPNGMTPPVRTVWEQRAGEDVARLVTAYRF